VDAAAIDAIAGAFHSEHERLYTYALRTMSVDVTAWRLSAIGRLPALPREEREAVSLCDPDEARKGERAVYSPATGRYSTTPIYDGGALVPGMVVRGPAVVELPTTTLVVFDGDTLTVNRFGSFCIALPANRAHDVSGAPAAAV
jgi:N-methylhydantoinase A